MHSYPQLLFHGFIRKGHMFGSFISFHQLCVYTDHPFPESRHRGDLEHYDVDKEVWLGLKGFAGPPPTFEEFCGGMFRKYSCVIPSI